MEVMELLRKHARILYTHELLRKGETIRKKEEGNILYTDEYEWLQKNEILTIFKLRTSAPAPCCAH